MDVDIVLQEMASCDFSKPLSVTIMCEEDEDDLKRENIADCPTPKLYMETEIASDKESNDLKEENRATVVQVSKEKISSNEMPDNFIKKNSIKKKKKTKLRPLQKKENSNNHNTSCTSSDTDIAIDSTSKLTSPKLDKSKNNNNLNEFESSGVTVNSIHQNKSSYEYVDDLLIKVSESLLHILEAYSNHVNNVRLYNSNDLRLQESKRRYNRIKHHFFQLSYCTTNVIILSRETDTKFTEYFFSITIRLAEQKNMKITVRDIQPLYYELISWAKQVKEMQTLPISSAITNSYDSPELRKFLSQPPVSSTTLDNSSSYSTAKVSIHNTNTRKPEIRISLEPDSQNKDLNENLQLGYGSQELININNQPGLPNIEQRYSNTLESDNYFMGYNVPNGVLNFYRPNVSVVTTTSTMNIIKDCLTNQSRCIGANCACRNLSADLGNPMNLGSPVNNRLPPTYEQANMWKNVPTRESGYDANISKQFENTNNTFSNLDKIRTPDSSFISSQQLNSSLENMVVHEVQNRTGTPLITHVTSLNPRAMQIEEGACHVCRKCTKQKCLGCYQTYYCSYQCQKQDWSQHMNICNTRAAGRQYTDVVFQ